MLTNHLSVVVKINLKYMTSAEGAYLFVVISFHGSDTNSLLCSTSIYDPPPLKINKQMQIDCNWLSYKKY